MNPCSPFPGINWILAAIKVARRAERPLGIQKRSGLFMSVALTGRISLSDVRFFVRKGCS